MVQKILWVYRIFVYIIRFKFEKWYKFYIELWINTSKQTSITKAWWLDRMPSPFRISQEQGLSKVQPIIKKSHIRETPTISACADRSTDTMQSRLFDSFLHFWALFSHFFLYNLLALFVTFLALFGKKKSSFMCHEPHVTCDMSHVTCHMSPSTGH